LAAALALALQLAVGQQAARREKTIGLRRYFLQELEKTRIEHQVIAAETAIPQILAISLPGLRAEVLLRAMAARASIFLPVLPVHQKGNDGETGSWPRWD
jgi:cysteine sulfinate desulfinase/cysteine desulfurase-like protein